MSTAESEPYLTVAAIDADAPGSFAELLDLQDLGEKIQTAQASGVGEGRLVKMAFDAITPRLRMSDGSDPAEAIRRVSINQAVALIQQISGQAAEAQDAAVNPPNGGPSGGPPSASAAKSNGHRPGRSAARSATSGG